MSMEDLNDGTRDGRGIMGPQGGRGFWYYEAYYRTQREFGNTGANAGGCGVIILLGAALYAAGWLLPHLVTLVPALAFIAFVLATMAFAGGAVILGLTRLTQRGAGVGYRRCVTAALTGACLYLGFTIVMRAGVAIYNGRWPAGDPVYVALSLLDAFAMHVGSFSVVNETAVFAAAAAPANWPALLQMPLLVRGPGILAFALLLYRKIRGPYRRLSGFALAIVVALLTLAVSLTAAVSVCLPIWNHIAVVPFGGDERLSILLVYSALLVVPCALIGGLAGAPIVWLLSSWLAPGHLGSFGRNYSIAARTLFTYGFCAVLAVFLFRDADTVLWPLARAVLGGAPHPIPDEEFPPALALFVLQLPALLLAAAVVPRRAPGFSGAIGFAKACAVAAITCVLIGAPFWIAALQFLPPIVLAINPAGLRMPH